MGKVNCLRNRFEPLAALLWALGIVQHLTLPAGLSLLHRHTQSMAYMVIVGSILNKDVLPPHLFLSMYVIYLWLEVTSPYLAGLADLMAVACVCV